MDTITRMRAVTRGRVCKTQFACLLNVIGTLAYTLTPNKQMPAARGVLHFHCAFRAFTLHPGGHKDTPDATWPSETCSKCAPTSRPALKHCNFRLSATHPARPPSLKCHRHSACGTDTMTPAVRLWPPLAASAHIVLLHLISYIR